MKFSAKTFERTVSYITVNFFATDLNVKTVVHENFECSNGNFPDDLENMLNFESLDGGGYLSVGGSFDSAQGFEAEISNLEVNIASETGFCDEIEYLAEEQFNYKQVLSYSDETAETAQTDLTVATTENVAIAEMDWIADGKITFFDETSTSTMKLSDYQITDFKFTENNNIVARCESARTCLFLYNPFTNEFYRNSVDLNREIQKFDVINRKIYVYSNKQIYERPILDIQISDSQISEPQFSTDSTTIFDVSISNVRSFAVFNTDIITIKASEKMRIHQLYKNFKNSKVIESGSEIFDSITPFNRSIGFLCSKEGSSSKVQGICSVVSDRNNDENEFTTEIVMPLDYSKYTTNIDYSLLENVISTDGQFVSTFYDVSSDVSGAQIEYFPVVRESTPELYIDNGDVIVVDQNGENPGVEIVLGHPVGQEIVKIYRIPNKIIAKSWSGRLYQIEDNARFVELKLKNPLATKITAETDFTEFFDNHMMISRFKSVYMSKSMKFPRQVHKLYTPRDVSEIESLKIWLQKCLNDKNIIFFIGFDGFSWTHSSKFSPHDVAPGLNLNMFRTDYSKVPVLKWDSENRELTWTSVARNSEHPGLLQTEIGNFEKCPDADSVKRVYWFVETAEFSTDSDLCVFQLKVPCDTTTNFERVNSSIDDEKQDFICKMRTNVGKIRNSGIIDIQTWFHDRVLVLYDSGLLESVSFETLDTEVHQVSQYQRFTKTQFCNENFVWDDRTGMCYEITIEKFGSFELAKNRCRTKNAVLGTGEIRHFPVGSGFWSNSGLKIVESGLDNFKTPNKLKPTITTDNSTFPAFCTKQPTFQIITAKTSNNTQYVKQQPTFPTKSVLNSTIPELDLNKHPMVEISACPKTDDKSTSAYLYGNICYFITSSESIGRTNCESIAKSGSRYKMNFNGTAEEMVFSGNLRPGLARFLLDTEWLDKKKVVFRYLRYNTNLGRNHSDALAGINSNPKMIKNVQKSPKIGFFRPKNCILTAKIQFA